MNENDRISGEQGSVKPEETLTNIVRQVAYARADGEKGAMRAAANGAFLHWLAEFHTSEVEDDQDILEFALQQQGFESWDDFLEAFIDAMEPTMAARKNLEGVDLDELSQHDRLAVEDSTAKFELLGDEDG